MDAAPAPMPAARSFRATFDSDFLERCDLPNGDRLHYLALEAIGPICYKALASLPAELRIKGRTPGSRRSYLYSMRKRWLAAGLTAEVFGRQIRLDSMLAWYRGYLEARGIAIDDGRMYLIPLLHADTPSHLRSGFAAWPSDESGVPRRPGKTPQVRNQAVAHDVGPCNPPVAPGATDEVRQVAAPQLRLPNTLCIESEVEPKPSTARATGDGSLSLTRGEDGGQSALKGDGLELVRVMYAQGGHSRGLAIGLMAKRGILGQAAIEATLAIADSPEPHPSLPGAPPSFDADYGLLASLDGASDKPEASTPAAATPIPKPSPASLPKGVSPAPFGQAFAAATAAGPRPVAVGIGGLKREIAALGRHTSPDQIREISGRMADAVKDRNRARSAAFFFEGLEYAAKGEIPPERMAEAFEHVMTDPTIRRRDKALSGQVRDLMRQRYARIHPRSGA